GSQSGVVQSHKSGLVPPSSRGSRSSSPSLAAGHLTNGLSKGIPNLTQHKQRPSSLGGSTQSLPQTTSVRSSSIQKPGSISRAPSNQQVNASAPNQQQTPAKEIPKPKKGLGHDHTLKQLKAPSVGGLQKTQIAQVTKLEPTPSAGSSSRLPATTRKATGPFGNSSSKAVLAGQPAGSTVPVQNGGLSEQQLQSPGLQNISSRAASALPSIGDCTTALNAAANTSGLPTPPPSGLRPPSGHFGRPRPSRPSSVVSTASSDHNVNGGTSSRRNSRLLQISTPPLLPETTPAPPPPLPPKETDRERSPSPFPPRPPKEAPPLPPKEQTERTPSPPPRPEARRTEDSSAQPPERNVELLLSEEPPPAGLNDISPVKDTCEDVECPSADDSGISYEEHTSSPKQSPDLLQQRLSDSSSLGSSSRGSHISQEDNQPTVVETAVSDPGKTADEVQTVQLAKDERDEEEEEEEEEEVEEVQEQKDDEEDEEEDEDDVEDFLRSRDEALHLQSSHCSSLSDTILVVDPLLTKIPEPPLVEIKSLTLPKPTAAVKGTQQTTTVLAYQTSLELERNTLPRCGPAMHKVAMVSPMVNPHGTNNNSKHSLEELKKSIGSEPQAGGQRKDEDEEIDPISPMQPLQPRNAPYGSYLRAPSANQAGQGAPNQGSSRFIPGGKYHVPSLRLQADPSRVAFARHLLAASQDMARLKHHPPGQSATQYGLGMQDDVGGYLSDGDVLRPGRGGCVGGVLEEIPSGYLSEGGASLYRRRHDAQQPSTQPAQIGSSHLGVHPVNQTGMGIGQSGQCGQSGRPNSNHPQGGSTPHKKMDPKLINVLCDDSLKIPPVNTTVLRHPRVRA
ncbi:hypothetical protein BIW11_11207, partial [Tropilaelaps mercedesae]